MQARSWIAVAFVALTLTACAAPGPRLGYEEFLPNTNENPAWARTTAQPASPLDAAEPRNTAPKR